jgi:hypothetical protein
MIGRRDRIHPHLSRWLMIPHAVQANPKNRVPTIPSSRSNTRTTRGAVVVSDVPNAQANAVKAGWNPADGDPPNQHGAEPPDAIEPAAEPLSSAPAPTHVAAPLSSAGAPTLAAAPAGTVSWAAVLTEMTAQVGFVEGPDNQNPWGPEQGIANAAYCCSFACMVPYHRGYRWPANCQFGVKGDAYVPFRRQHAIEQGEWLEDHASAGRPADVEPGDQLIYVWPGGDGAGDHIETAIAPSPSGNTTNIGANTGSPEGVHTVVRSRQYLLGRIRPKGYGAAAVAVSDGNPFTPLAVDGQFGPQTIKALQWRLNFDGAKPPLVIDGEFGPLSTQMLQDRLNAVAGPVTIDGQIGPETISALQRHLGVPVDGQWGPQTSSRLQELLNAGSF